MINESRHIENRNSWCYRFTAYKDNIPVYTSDHCGNPDYFERKAKNRLRDLKIEWDRYYLGQKYVDGNYRYSCIGTVKNVANKVGV